MPDASLVSAVPAPVGWMAVAALVLWLLRFFIKQGRNDINEYKLGGVYADRVAALEMRVNRLELDKSRLIKLAAKLVAHFGGCGHCAVRAKARSALEAEYDKVMEEVNK